MTPTTPKPNPLPRAALLLAIALAVGGCGTQPPQPAPTEPSGPPVAAPETPRVSLDIPASRHAEVFTSAEYYLLDFDWMSAEETLATLSREELTPDDAGYLTYLEGRIAFVRGDQALAVKKLVAVEQPGVHPAFRYRAFNLHRRSESLAGNHVLSALLGWLQMDLAPDTERGQLRREIWFELQRADEASLRRSLQQEADPVWRGWLELALLVRQPQVGPGEIALWRDSHPLHPAANPLPGGLDHLLDGSEPMGRVALLLPLSGRLAPAGHAVRDGYLANYYAARSRGRAGFELEVIDLDLFPSADAAYDEAAARGAELVIGPLSKESVAALDRRPERPVPVLALNRIEGATAGTGAALVQLSLSPEDEAARLAELAFGRGARRAAILRPATAWGEKVEEALRIHWQELGGSVASNVAYGEREDHSGDIKSALGIPASESRARDVRDMLGTNVEFTARRRRDIDAVFLLAANGSEARSLKPLLAFHYAGSIPVYSISSIYSGLPNARDRDLDGITVVEIPWLLGANAELRVAIAAGDTGSDLYTRLNALGADAFLLQQNFPVLRSGPDALLRGNTGLLAMDPQLRMRRRDLPAATFDGGELKPL